MSIKGTIVKFSVFAVVMALVVVALVVVFAQVRFNESATYRAQFTDLSGLRANQFVRIAGVEVGKVEAVKIRDNTSAEVEFTVAEGVTLTESTRALVRYENLVGDRYLELVEGSGEGSGRVLSPEATIAVTNTEPALDLDALLGGFRPLFKALDPDQVNRLSTSLVAVFQGQGGTIDSLLGQTAQLTSALADRDQLIGSVIANLNGVLKTVDSHNAEFDTAIDQLQQLVTGLSTRSDPLADALMHIDDASESVAALLGQTRPDIANDVNQLNRFSTQFNEGSEFADKILGELPEVYGRLSRLGLYGDFFTFYFCDAQLKVNGPDGEPVYIKFFAKPVGRCTPA